MLERLEEMELRLPTMVSGIADCWESARAQDISSHEPVQYGYCTEQVVAESTDGLVAVAFDFVQHLDTH